jgi:hypothetical protein
MIIKRIIEDKTCKQHTLLTYSLLEDRTTTKASTCFNPFQLINDQETILPIEPEISSIQLMLQTEELNYSNVSQRINT